jgi:AcrR family transcriptional regulator
MDNRSAILSHALLLFASKGYDAVGVQEIVDAAGITKPTLYHYFGSKRGLLEALLAAYFSEFNASLQPAVNYTGDLPQTLRCIATTFFEFARENPAFYRLALGLWFAPKDSEGFQAVIKFNREQFDWVEQVFLKAVRQHGNMRGRHSAYAATFIGMLNTYIGMALNDYTQLDTALVEQALHQFQHGIYS